MNCRRLYPFWIIFACLWCAGLGIRGVGDFPEAAAYVRAKTDNGIPVAWAQMPISYWVGKAGSASVSDGSEIQALHEAFAVWSNVDCARVSFRFEGLIDNPRMESSLLGNHANHVFWIKEPDRWPYAKQVLAATKLTWDSESGILRDTDLVFNDHAFRWSTETPSPPDHHDVKNTAVHEIGHLLGLDHSPVSVSTMFAEAPPGELQKRDLDADDIQGVCAIYPKQPPPGTWVVLSADDGLQRCPEVSDTSQTQPAPMVGCHLLHGTTSSARWSGGLVLFCWWLSCGIGLFVLFALCKRPYFIRRREKVDV